MCRSLFVCVSLTASVFVCKAHFPFSLLYELGSAGGGRGIVSGWFDGGDTTITATTTTITTTTTTTTKAASIAATTVTIILAITSTVATTTATIIAATTTTTAIPTKCHYKSVERGVGIFVEKH